MKVRLPNTMNGSRKKDLSPDQRSLLIILEDATLRYLRDEVRFLLNLKDVQQNGNARLDARCILDFIDRRVREIRRWWPHDKAEGYEERLLEAVDECDGERHQLHIRFREALTQYIPYQSIERAEYIAVAGGLIHSCARVREWLTGKVHHYDLLDGWLRDIDTRLETFLLNSHRDPNMGEAREWFAKLFDSLCKAVLDKFTERKEIAR